MGSTPIARSNFGDRMWNIGQKLICINVNKSPHAPIHYNSVGRYLKLNSVYTFLGYDNHPRLNVPCIYVEEVSFITSYQKRIMFGVWRFRPVVEYKNDIQVFQDILKNLDVSVKV